MFYSERSPRGKILIFVRGCILSVWIISDRVVGVFATVVRISVEAFRVKDGALSWLIPP